MTPPSVERHAKGWRAGKPAEDPTKTKRWGVVSAKPSEFLIHVRAGEPTARSGQGASCFKWPWESVAVVPTSLQRLAFRANQITSEKVGVEVVGLGVYRIADPLLAFRLLNFSYPERAQEKLREVLTDMLIGATRRIVASLGVEACLSKRKSALAEGLLAEIAPVVGGQGRPEDDTDRGWGVVIDTIEIQEVRIQSAQVFEAMQAPFRSTLDQQAREARASAEEQVAAREAACKQAAEGARLQAQAAIEAQRRALHSAKVEAESQARLDAMIRLRREAEAEIDAHTIRARAQHLAYERALAEAEAEGAIKRVQAELTRVVGAAEAEAAKTRAEAEAIAADAQVKLTVARGLPEIAQAIGEGIDQVRLVHVSADDPWSRIAGALGAALGPREDRTI